MSEESIIPTTVTGIASTEPIPLNFSTPIQGGIVQKVKRESKVTSTRSVIAMERKARDQMKEENSRLVAEGCLLRNQLEERRALYFSLIPRMRFIPEPVQMETSPYSPSLKILDGMLDDIWSHDFGDHAPEVDDDDVPYGIDDILQAVVFSTV